MVECYFIKRILSIVLILTSLNLFSQIKINEILATNATVFEDAANDNFSDWIELYNAGATSVNLKGYYLTDNLDKPDKFQINTDVVISAGGYLIFWADDLNQGTHTSFKLSSDGEVVALYSPQQEIIDSVSFTYQKVDISYGRTTDGASTWSYFTRPTPKASNTSTAFNGFVESKPNFSVRGGMFTRSVLVELTANLGGEIRYTMDGSEPDENSTKYSTAINIAQTTVLRARIFKANLVAGPIVTHSYFINENSIDGRLPVVSLATDDDNFWHPEKGIYVQDFKPLWEVPANIELFENNGSDRAAFNEQVGTKVNGLWSWQLPQKMLGIYFKKQYGSGNLEYPLFSQRTRNSFKSFALRASGSDWSYTLFRDAMEQHITQLNMQLDIMSYKPAVVYVNGQYLGIHNIREKVDDDYIEKSYGLASGSFDMIENEDYVEAGSIDAYRKLQSLLKKDLTNQANFELATEDIDLENFTDFVITELLTANSSIGHNVMAWKPKEGGQWKWIVMDLDRGFFKPSGQLINFYLEAGSMPFQAIFENKTYQTYFAERLTSQVYASFNPIYVHELIDEHKNWIEPEISRHIERWLGTTSSYGNAMPSVNYWYNQVHNLKLYANERPSQLLADLKNYGFNDAYNLSLVCEPANAGQLYINNLQIPKKVHNGMYLNDMEATLTAKAQPGFAFLGWKMQNKQHWINKQTEWKYFDAGTAPDDAWKTMAFDDAAWKTGTAPLGYGEPDIQTVLDYGSNADNKRISSYFRKKFTLKTSDINAKQVVLNIKKDDGAMVYVNGNEVLRLNMARGAINAQSLAVLQIDDASFYSYPIAMENFVVGENVIAIEVHQKNKDSGDLMMEMELFAFYDTPNTSLNANKTIDFKQNGHTMYCAVFEEIAACIVPQEITSNTTLSKECSPYIVQGNVVVNEHVRLTIEKGVEIWMPEKASIQINGSLLVNGVENEEVIFRINPEYAGKSWGILYFKNCTDPSFLNHLIIEDANMGSDPVLEKAAISIFHASVIMDHLVLENNFANPISARYADVVLKNSRLYSAITGDLINVKYGKAHIEHCVFNGNDKPDTDAIDYDEIENGVIKNCIISNFTGFNSDAIDIGEKASGIVIDSIYVYSVTDKGVSVGQQSSASVSNSVFVNCNMGLGVKDSSIAVVSHCLFYGTGRALAGFEKNVGEAGGNIWATNNIISNSYDRAFFIDGRSTGQIINSLSDTDTLPSMDNNIWANPFFIAPSFFNFNFESYSDALTQGIFDSNLLLIENNGAEPLWNASVHIDQLFIDANNLGYPEFIAIKNPSDQAINVSNYSITKGFTFVFPDQVWLAPDSVVYISNDSKSLRWGKHTVFQWESGKLSNNGEAIQLEDERGTVIDYIRYDENTWPQAAFLNNEIMVLKNGGLDNHLGENWETESVDKVLDTASNIDITSIIVVPNPSNGVFSILGINNEAFYVEVFDLSGQLVFKQAYQDQLFDVSYLNTGVYLVKVKDTVQKLIITHNN